MDMNICAYKHITFSATTVHILMSPTFGEGHLHLTCNMLPAIQIALFGIQLSVSLPFFPPEAQWKSLSLASTRAIAEQEWKNWIHPSYYRIKICMAAVHAGSLPW